MNRDSEALLLDFCVEQQEHFKKEAWLHFDQVSPAELAAVVLFLSATPWFGNEGELQHIAEIIRPGYDKKYADLAKVAGFDWNRFSGLLKQRLGRC